MKKLLLILLLLINSAYAQKSHNQVDINKSAEVFKNILVDLRNQMVLAETEEEYQEIFDDLGDKIAATESNEYLKRTLKSKVTHLGDFSMRSLFVKKLDNTIEMNSTNIFLLSCINLSGWDDRQSCQNFFATSPVLLVIFLFPIWLADTEVSSDI